MNSLIAAYRKTPTGQKDSRSDEDIVRQDGPTWTPDIRARFPDAVADFTRLSKPAGIAAPPTPFTQTSNEDDAYQKWLNTPDEVAPTATPSAGLGRTAGDIGLALAQGGANVAEGIDTIVGDFTPLGAGYRKLTGTDLRPIKALADTLGIAAASATGNADGVEQFVNEGRKTEDASDLIARQKSDALQQRGQERAQAMEDASEGKEGWRREFARGWEFLAGTAKSPRLLTDLIVTQIPQLIPSSAAAGLAMKLAPASKVAAVLASRLAGAAMQGADVGNDTRKDLSNLLTNLSEADARKIPELDTLLKDGLTLDQAKAQFALDQGRKAGVLGGLASVVANSIPGIGGGVEDALARMASRPAGAVAGSLAAGAVTGALKELPGELIEEGAGNIFKNLGAQPVDPNRPLTQGLGETLAAAGVGAVGTGGATGLYENVGASPKPTTGKSFKFISPSGMEVKITAPTREEAIKAATKADPTLTFVDLATAARRAAMTAPATTTAPATPAAASALTPSARAALLVQANPQGAVARLAVLDTLNKNNGISPSEMEERFNLVRLIAPDRIVIDPKQADIDKKNGVPAAIRGMVMLDKGQPPATPPPSQVPASGAVAVQPVTPTAQKPTDVGSPPSPATNLPAAVVAVPLVKPTTAGDLRLRVKRANATLERINREVPGIKPSEALDAVRNEIAAGTVDDATVTRLEQSVDAMDRASIAIAQARSLEAQQQQTTRAKLAAEKQRAAQEKRNAAAVEKLAKSIRREQQAAFRADPAGAVAELQAERDLAASAGADVRELDARIAEFTAKIPKAAPTADAVASAVSNELAVASQARADVPVVEPSTAPVPLAFGKVAFAGRDALGGFSFEGFANGLAKYARDGKLTPEIASGLAADLERAVTAEVARSAANKEGGIYAPDGNSSETRTALALQMPDGSVVLAGLLAPKKLASVDGSGRSPIGLRIARMANKASSGGGKAIKPNGSSPILLSDLLAAGIFPIDAVRFNEEPGKPFQQFPSRASYYASVLAVLPNVEGKSVRTEGGEDPFRSGGAGIRTGEGGTSNQDAVQAAENRGDAATDTTSADDAALNWSTDDGTQTNELFRRLTESVGRMAPVREQMEKSKAKATKTLREWLGDVTEGIDNADLAIERMYQIANGNAEVFADLGGEAANWIAQVSDNQNATAETNQPAIEASASAAAIPQETKPETSSAPSVASIGELWSRMAGEGYDVTTTLAKMQASKSKKVQALVQEFVDAGIGQQEITDALAVATQAKAEKKTSKADTRTADERLVTAQLAAFTKFLRGDGALRLDASATLSPTTNESLQTTTGTEGQGSPGSSSRVGTDLGGLAADIRAITPWSGPAQGAQPERIGTEQAGLASLGLREIPFPAKGEKEGFEHRVINAGNGRVLKFVSDHSGIPHGWKVSQAFRDADGQLRLTDLSGPRQSTWKKNGITLSIATPSEYLQRWDLFNDVFGQDVRVEGYSRRPDGSLALVISQTITLGRQSTMQEVASYLKSLGFEPSRNPNDKLPLWAWQRFSDGISIADVKPDNFRTDDHGNVHALDVVIGETGKLRIDAPAGRDQSTAEQAQGVSATQRVIDRLRPFVDVTRVARVLSDRSGNVSGMSISPSQIVLAMDDVAFQGNKGLVTLIHEAQHSLFDGLPDKTQASISRAVQRSIEDIRAKAATASKRTGIRVAGNIGESVDEALVEATAQQLTAEGIAEPQSMAAALWRAVKDIYLRASRALLEGLGAPQERIDRMALDWWENYMRRMVGGDFDSTFIRLMDRFTPATSVQRVAAMENPTGTPGNLADYIDPLTGTMTAPSDAKFSMQAAPQGPNLGAEIDLPPEESWKRIEGAKYNEIAPVFADMKRAIAPDMPNEKWWAILGTGEDPEVTLRNIEARVPGASSARINGEGMTDAMNQRASSETLETMLGARKKLTKKLNDSIEKINKASDGFIEQREAVAKTDREYRSAAAMDSAMRDSVKKDLRELLSAMDQGVNLGRDAGRLGAMLKAGENMLEGEAIPEEYQAVFKSVLDGSTPLFDYLSAVAKLGLNLPSMTQSEAVAAIRAAAPTDTRLAALVANRPLLNTLTALARSRAKEMALLQLNQLSNSTEATAIKKEMEALRTASEEALDKMWADIQTVADRSSLSMRLREAMLKERRELNRITRAMRDGNEMVRILEGASSYVDNKITDLEKSVGNFSDWRPVPTFVGKVRNDPQWLAMKPKADGTWESVTRTLRFTDKDEVADVDRVREDLMHNDQWLRENTELRGTKTYQQVEQQTRQIQLLDLERQSLAAHRVSIIDGLLPSVFKKFKDTGTSGGEQIARGGNKFVNIMRQHQAEIDGLSQDWTKAFTDLYKQAGAGFRDWNDFYDRVVVPTIYKIESEIGRDEKGALREARKTARANTPSPLDGFDAALDKLMQRTKTASEYMLKVAEENGVFIADPRLNDQLRRAISYGWLTAPRSLNSSVVNTLMKTMGKQGWSVEWKTETKQNSQGDTIEGRSVTNGNTFDKVNTEAADLGSQIARFFTAEVVDNFLVPFIRKPGKAVFYTPDGEGIDSLVAESAWNDSGGDVAKWIDLLGERSGALEQLANEKREDGDTASPLGKWRRSMLDRIDSRWAMEMKLVNNTGNASNVMSNDRPVMHSLMDARLNDDIPPEHLTYNKFDAVSTHTRLGQIAYHAAFGRDGSGMDRAIQSALSEVQNRIDARKSIWDQTTSKAERKRLAKEAGYDYNTLDRSLADYKRVVAWSNELRGLFSPVGRSGVLSDISAGAETMRMVQLMMLNQPTSGLMNAASLFDFPTNYKSFGKLSTRATMTAMGQFVQRLFGSFAQDIANRNLLDTEYLDWIGPITDKRSANSREWSTKMADIGAHGSYANQGAGLGERIGVGVKRATRFGMNALEKGLTPGEVLLRKGTPAQGQESRFTALTSPFKFFNDLIMQSVALTNVRQFELVMKRAMDYAAANPGVLDNPNLQFTPEDLNMGGNGFFGDAKALAWMRQNAADYGLGNIENMARAAIDNKARGERIFNRDQAIKLAIMAMDQIAGEGGVTTRPSESYTNPVARLASPMLGWAMWRSQKVAEAFRESNGTREESSHPLLPSKSFVNGLKTMALASLPLAYLFSLGMEEWDEWARGKKTQLGAKDTFLGVTQRLSRVGTMGIVGDLGFGAFTPLDPASGQRQFTLDSKIFAYNTIANIAGGVRDVAMQGLDNTTWASGERALAMVLGGNGPIQYVQMLNKLGFNVSEAEARVLARQNIYAAVRAAAVTADVPVRKAGGSATPSARGTWVREMQLAAFSGDRVAFRDAYLRAIAAAKESGEDDPQAVVRKDWNFRSPFRVLANDRPTDLELRKIQAAMDPEGRAILQSAMRNYATFTAFIQPTPAEKALARARRVTDPAVALAARRKAMGMSN